MDKYFETFSPVLELVHLLTIYYFLSPCHRQQFDYYVFSEIITNYNSSRFRILEHLQVMIHHKGNAREIANRKIVDVVQCAVWLLSFHVMESNVGSHQSGLLGHVSNAVGINNANNFYVI